MPRLTDYVDMDKKFDALRAEIERLTAENERLRMALSSLLGDYEMDVDWHNKNENTIRAANAALNAYQQQATKP